MTTTTYGGDLKLLFLHISKKNKHMLMYFEYAFELFCGFLYFVCFFRKQKRRALENGAYTTNFQPVNSDLSAFYAFSVLGPGRSEHRTI